MSSPTTNPILHSTQRIDAAFASAAGGPMVVVLKLEKLTEFDTQALTTDIEAVAPKCSWKLALDMTNVALVTSAGLGWLIQIRKRAETQQANGSKGKVVLFGLSPELLGLLKATKLLTLLPHAKDRSAAIAMFAG